MSFVRHVLLAVLLAPSALSFAAETYANYGVLWTGDRKFYLLNNGYSLPSGATIYGNLTNQNTWRGLVRFNGTSGGAGVQLNYGKWPWSQDLTSGSVLPKKIESNSNLRSNWTFTLNNISGNSWNAFWELWTHTSNNCTGSNITCDLMVHPQYDAPVGTYHHSVTFDSVGYGVYAQPRDSSRAYPIIHYYRSSKTATVPTIRFDHFLWDCVRHGWARQTDWLGSITAGIENAKDSAGLSTTAYRVF